MAASSSPALAAFWLDDRHADTAVEIILRHSSGSGDDGNDDGDAIKYTTLARVPAHAVLLAASSAFFEAALAWPSSSPPPQQAGDGDGGDGQLNRRRQLQHRVTLELSSADDLPAAVALLRCGYTGDVSLPPGDLAAVAAAAPSHTPPAAAAAGALSPPLLHHKGSGGGSTACGSCCCDCCCCSGGGGCWQELCVRVMRLADELGCHAALAAAAARLSRLFSSQLSWPAVLAVLHLPAAHHHGFQQHQQLHQHQPAASAAAAAALQELRAMALARVAHDLRHLDRTLAAPLGRAAIRHLPAGALAALLGSDGLALDSENSVLCAVDVWLTGPEAARLAEQQRQQQRQQQEQQQRAGAEGGGGGALRGALQLLVRQARLALCSGAFLAAAVERRAWLLHAGFGRRAGQAQLPPLPRPLNDDEDDDDNDDSATDRDAGNVHNTDDGSGDINGGGGGDGDGDDELQLLRRYAGADAEGRYALAMALLRAGRRCPWSVPLRRGLPASFDVALSARSSGNSIITQHGGGFADAVTPTTRLSQLRAVLLGGGGGGQATPVPLLARHVVGGYVWTAALTAAPADSWGSAGGTAATPAAAAAAAAAARHGPLVLALELCCRPAWASELCGIGGVGSDGDDDDTGEAAATLLKTEACGCAHADGGEGFLAATAPAAAAAAAVGGACAACSALHDIARGKSAEVVARHAPLPCPANAAAAAAVAWAAPRLQPGGDGGGDSAVGGGAVSSVGSSRRDPRDVVAAVRISAAPSAEQLPALAAAAGSVPVLLPWDTRAGAARGLVPLDVAGGVLAGTPNLVAASASDALAAAAAVAGAWAGADGGGDAADGWRPEVWSGVAPSGVLFWRVAVRPLAD